ncbi:MAG: hypothetical protein IPJ69_02050 [Deltaproteobacteria bacterium]|nr:MAG: hypothetical protein IPJ69_02050 [Deltaproteobacteria bacterium]
MKSNQERQKHAIDEYVKITNYINNTAFITEHEPDKGDGCDAILKSGKAQIALEHTTVDMFENQRGNEAIFSRQTERRPSFIPVVPNFDKTLKSIIDKKSLRLKSYQTSFKTGLLIESNDFQITNASEICSAFWKLASDNLEKVRTFDDVYLITTAPTAKPLLYPIKIGEKLGKEALAGEWHVYRIKQNKLNGYT